MVAGGKSAPYRSPPTFGCGPMMPHSSDEASSPEREGLGAIPAFFNGIMSPFMACWQPPFEACATPMRGLSGGSPTTVPPLSVDSPYSLSPQSSVVALTNNIRTPHSNDVLCGRGGSSNRHVGNLNFRALVSANKETYVTLTKKQKMMMARSIVNTIRAQDPPGRFLQKDPHTGLWNDIGTPRSLEKTSQALREKPNSPGKEPKSPDSSDTGDYPDDEARSPSPVLPSSPTTPASSPVQPVSPLTTPKSRKSVPVPVIKIPEHLEEQFNPQLRHQRLMKQRPPPRPGWSPPPIPHGPPQPYLSLGNPDIRYASSHMVYQPPYGPPEYGMPPVQLPPPPASYPHMHQQPPSRSPARLVPPSPPRSMPGNNQQIVTPPRSGPQQQRHGRQAGKISPGRAQDSKRRRQGSPSTSRSAHSTRNQSSSSSCLSQDMQSRLSLHEDADRDPYHHQKKEIPSPSRVTQSRARPRSGADEADALAGLAALSSAVFLKMEEEERK